MVSVIVLVASALIAVNSTSGGLAQLTDSPATSSVSTIGNYPFFPLPGSPNATTVESTSSIASQASSSKSTSTTATFPPEVDTGLALPLFSQFSQNQLNSVNTIIKEKVLYPWVPMIVVLNPSCLPGNLSNTNMKSEVKRMQAVQIGVFEYIPTNWATTSISAIEAEIYKCNSFYQPSGILLDQIPNWEYNGPKGQPYYSGQNGTFIPAYLSNITSYAKSLGLIVFGEAGTDVPENFIGTMDALGIFENAFLPPFFSSTPNFTALSGNYQWHLNYSKNLFFFTSYNITSFNPYFVVSASDYVGYLYLTNGKSPQPYGSLPPYFDQLVSTVASIVPITVQAELPNGVLTGLTVTVTQPDGTSSKGFTPFMFNVLSNTTVSISADPTDGTYVFSHWSNGATNPETQVSAGEAATLVAYYS
ncbi:MAG: spherulation-specific family 4 protein [Nitrososphaerales archaeon]